MAAISKRDRMTDKEKPEASGSWEIFILEYARSKDQPVASLLQGAYDQGVIDLPFAFVLARSGKRSILVDCGFMREGNGIAVAEKFGIPDWISPVRMLAEMGVQPAEITDIFVSHAHFDHMGSIEKFPNATVHLQKRELLSWVELMALPRRFSFLTMVLDPDLHSSRCGALRQFPKGLSDPAVSGSAVRSRLDGVTENSQARRAQFRGQIRHPLSFGDPKSAFGCIWRMKSATCIQARDGQTAIR